jgi:hypothetical protein
MIRVLSYVLVAVGYQIFEGVCKYQNVQVIFFYLLACRHVFLSYYAMYSTHLGPFLEVYVS